MRFRSVFFDCDSTLSSIEGIDELGRAYREEIVPLTEAAMRGEVPLESVYGRRLAIIRPSREALDRVGEQYTSTLVPGAREVVAALRALGVEVSIISGGLRPAVLHVATALGVPRERVHAVDIRFGEHGEYAGFDESSPLARQGGKPALIESLGVPRPSMLVGDGATDLEARPAVDCFVAFAGVAARAPVIAGADAVIHANSLLPVLPLVLGDDDASFPPELQSLIDEGRALLAPSPASLSPDRSPS